ncbi:uncharacterized protein LOC111115408 isoform X2 [Crassostrea virginica]
MSRRDEFSDSGWPRNHAQLCGFNIGNYPTTDVFQYTGWGTIKHHHTSNFSDDAKQTY